MIISPVHSCETENKDYRYQPRLQISTKIQISTKTTDINQDYRYPPRLQISTKTTDIPKLECSKCNFTTESERGLKVHILYLKINILKIVTFVIKNSLI